MADEVPGGGDPPEFARRSSTPVVNTWEVDVDRDPEDVPCPDCGKRELQEADDGAWKCRSCDWSAYPNSFD